MQILRPALFDGLPAEELLAALDRLERRKFPVGAVLLTEGEFSREMYIVESGAAEIFVAGQYISQVGPGSTLGDMSLITGRPVSATVRATADLDVLVLSENDLQSIATRFPRIYRNLVTILSTRLTRANQRELRGGAASTTLLVDYGAPPLVGYALACSVAWHTRRSVMLLVVDNDPPAALSALASSTDGAQSLLPPGEALLAADERAPGARAHLALRSCTGAFAPEALAETIEDLAGSYDGFIIAQVRAGQLPSLRPAATVCLTGSHGPIPDARNGETAPSPGHTIRAWVPGGSERPNQDGVLSMPPLSPADEEALPSGRLPATTAAGRAIGWAARDLAGLKVGIAFGGGSIKGFAHVGVLRVLERVGLRADYVAGTSIGASVAAVYALGYGPDEIADKMDLVGAAAFRLHLSTSALLSNSGLREGLRAIGGSTRIEDMRVPLAVTAADIFTRQEVVFRSGLAWPAVLASMSIPGIYPAVRLGHHTLVDGGVLNPVPSNVAAAMGADTVIAIKLGSSPEHSGVLAEADDFGPGRVPSVVQVIARSVEIMQTKISTDTAAAATILITPEFPETPTGWAGLRRFGEGRRFIELGEAAAEEALPRIGANLPWIAP